MTRYPVGNQSIVRCAVALVAMAAPLNRADVHAEVEVGAAVADLRNELANPELQDRERVDLVVASLRTARRRLLEARPEARVALWNKIAEMKTLAREAIGSPRGVLIEVQLALATAAQADIFRSAPSLTPKALTAARSGYRSAIAELSAAENRVDGQLRAQYFTPPRQRKRSPWTTRELESLRRHVKVQLARVYRKQASCYAVSSADRANALTLALEQVNNVVAAAEDEPITWQARVEQVICLRMLERLDDVRTQAARWQAMSPPAEVAAQLTAAMQPTERPQVSPAAAQLNASTAHLVVIGETAKRLRDADPAPSAAELAAYVAQLEEHVQKWPHQPSADTARWWLARQLMSQRRWTDAAQHLAAIDEACPYFDGVMRARAECYGQQLTALEQTLSRKAVAESLLGILPTIYEQEVQPQLLAKLVRWEGMAHEVLRQLEQALAAYDRWCKLSPNNADALEAYAKLIAQSNNPNDQREALRDWQRIEHRSKPGGERWQRARRARITLLRQLGNKEQADKLAKLTNILYPQWAEE